MSGTTSFPDVTLAEQKPLTSPSSDVNEASTGEKGREKGTTLSAAHSKETVVFVRGSQVSAVRRGVLHLTRCQVVLLVLLALLVLTIFVLLTAFVTREFCAKESAGEDQGMSQGGASPGNSTFPAPVTADNRDYPKEHPFSGLRLPRALLPSHYDLELRVNLKTFTFTGACNITVHVNASTRHVVFHRNELVLNESLVRVRSLPHHEWKVVKQYHVASNQFHVIEVDRDLLMGLTLTVELGSFAGKIRDDLRGLYQSSYKTADGEVKRKTPSQASRDRRRAEAHRAGSEKKASTPSPSGLFLPTPPTSLCTVADQREREHNVKTAIFSYTPCTSSVPPSSGDPHPDERQTDIIVSM